MSAALGLAERTKQTGHPFWHTREPVLAITEIDPGFGRLRELVPRSWRSLVRAKYCLDAVMAQKMAAAAVRSQERTKALLELLEHDLLEVAQSEGVNGHQLLAQQALVAAQGVSAYRETGRWSRTAVVPLPPDGPWMFLGPMAPWAMQSMHEPLTLLFVIAESQSQSAVDRVDASLSIMSDLVRDVLGSPASLPHDLPRMRTGDLLLAGGAAATGHKNFAHFFPLDALAADALSTRFTLAFSNIHRVRLARCSLRLRDAVGGSRDRPDLDDLVTASIGWFRAHDLSHFWCIETEPPAPAAHDPVLSPFERIALEEALADVLGLICAAEMFDRDAVSLAFSAEMLRYLTRRHREFADSAAAVLELGWMAQRGPVRWSDPEAWLDAALLALRDLAPALRRSLQAGTGASQLRDAMDAGICEADRLKPRLTVVPSDLEYSFG